MELILVRHTAVDVDPGCCYGQTDVPLKDSFEQEATKVSATLPRGPFDAVYTSPLSRCTRLATFCGYPDAHHEPRLMEMNFGAWEMQFWNQITDPQLHRWYEDWVHTVPSGGESFVMLSARISTFLSEIQAKGYQRVLCFTHGGVIACSRVLCGYSTAQHAFTPPATYGEIFSLSVPTHLSFE